MNVTYKDLTINQFKQIRQIASKAGQEEEIDGFIRILSVITGKPEDTYYDLPIPRLKQELAKLTFLKEEFKPNEPNTTYTVAGVKYKLTMNPNTMTAGQYIDYTTLLNERPEDYPTLLAVLLIPKGKKYGDGYDVAELAKTLGEHFKMADAMGICFFFTQLLKALTEATLASLTRTLKKEMKKEKDPDRINQIKKSIEAISGLPLSDR